MKALLICPDPRPAVAPVADGAPLVNATLLGKRLVEYWLEYLADKGAREVWLLASDRPEQVREAVGDGRRWGLRAEVIPESSELTPEAARAKYGVADPGGWLPEGDAVNLMDHFPGLPQQPLFASYGPFFAALQAWLPRAQAAGRLGMSEIQPGIWVGRHTHIAAGVRLNAPCWLGENVRVGARSVVGPLAILENGVVVGARSEIVRSVVGPATFVGTGTEVRNSLVHGSTLINWERESCCQVPDPFLLCDLAPRSTGPQPGAVWGRLVAAIAMLLTLPVAALVMFRSAIRRRPVLRARLGVQPRFGQPQTTVNTFVYYELAQGRSWLRRWPQFWSIVRGDMVWVGNRPLNPALAGRLANDFERLWLAAPAGLISLADAEGCRNFFGDAARAQASYYAAIGNWRLDAAIFARTLSRLLFGFVLASFGWSWAERRGGVLPKGGGLLIYENSIPR